MGKTDSEIRIVIDEKGVKRVDVVGHSGLQRGEIGLLTKIMPEIPKLDGLIRGLRRCQGKTEHGDMTRGRHAV